MGYLVNLAPLVDCVSVLARNDLPRKAIGEKEVLDYLENEAKDLSTYAFLNLQALLNFSHCTHRG